jgi:PAS domain S-box-containing protein
MEDKDKTKAQLIGELTELRQHISERARDEKALRESEEQYRILVNNSHDIVCSLTPDGIITFVSPQIARFGYAPEEMISKHFLNFIPLDQQPMVLHSFETGTKNGTSLPTVFQWQGKDGGLYWVETVGKTLYDEAGGPLCRVGVMHDITQRVQMEEALRESEERYHTTIDALSDSIHVVDRDLRFILSNQALRDMAAGFGIEQDPTGKTVFEYFPSLPARVRAEYEQVLETGEPLATEEATVIGQRTAWTETRKIPILDQDGRVYRVITIMRDITERKRAEAELLEKEYIIESASSVIATADLEGGMTYMNPAFLELWGFDDEQEVLGRHFKEFWMVEEQLAEILHMLQGEGRWSGELKARKADGSLFDVQVLAATVLDRAGEPVSLMSSSIDITQRVRMERQIERLNRLKEDLLSPRSLDEKLKCITDGIVAIFDADFARIWITQPGDLCDSGCFHAGVEHGPHVCRYRDRCLCLRSSSGRYTHVDGEVHKRVPFGCYKIGRVAAGEEAKFITSDVAHNLNVHNHAWARELGLVSFAGYRLLSKAGEPIGILALFSKRIISPDEDALLKGLANTTAQVIQTARAAGALQQLTRNLFLLNRVSQELTTTLDQLQIREQLLKVVTEIVGAEGASVWLWEEEQTPQPNRDTPQDRLVCRAASPHGQGGSPLNMHVLPG